MVITSIYAGIDLGLFLTYRDWGQLVYACIELGSVAVLLIIFLIGRKYARKPQEIRTKVGVKILFKEDDAPTKPLKAYDNYSLGHLVAGVVLAFTLFFIAKVVFWWDSRVWVFMVYYSYIFWGVFVVWELLERTVVKKYIYKKGWRETPMNSVFDVLVAGAGFELTIRLLFLVFL